MSKKETSRHDVLVAISVQTNKWFDYKIYEYKLFADNTEKKFTHIKFVDINGVIMGIHSPTKLQTIYDKAAAQMKQNTVKAVSEIRQAVDEVADVAVGAATEIKEDVMSVATQTMSIATSLFGKIKTVAQDKFKKTSKNDDQAV